MCALRTVAEECRRVLRDDGVLFLNLGDSYTSGNRVGHGTRVGYKQQTNRGMNDDTAPPRAPQPPGLKNKNLLGIPWRVALALQQDGWILRSDIIWHSQNKMPESVRDRPTRAHEHIFLFAKQPRYFFDAVAIAEPSVGPDRPREKHNGESAVDTKMRGFGSRCGSYQSIRNSRDVWQANEPLYRLRCDLSASDRAYVLGELARLGL